MTDSGRFTHKVVKQPSISLAQDRESLPARTDVLTTELTIVAGYVPRRFTCPQTVDHSCHGAKKLRIHK